MTAVVAVTVTTCISDDTGEGVSLSIAAFCHSNIFTTIFIVKIATTWISVIVESD